MYLTFVSHLSKSYHPYGFATPIIYMKLDASYFA